MRKLFLLVLVVLFGTQLQAQYSLEPVIRYHSSISSNAGILDFNLKNSYSYDPIEVGANLVLNYTKEQLYIARGIQMNAYYQLNNRVQPGIFYHTYRHSDALSEVNFGLHIKQILAGFWRFEAGVHSRIYKSRTNFNFPTSNEKIIEWRNFMYSVRRDFIKDSSNLQIYAVLTNYNDYLIQHETNPFIVVGAEKDLFDKHAVRFETTYNTAGFNNIRVQYFSLSFLLAYKIQF